MEIFWAVTEGVTAPAKIVKKGIAKLSEQGYSIFLFTYLASAAEWFGRLQLPDDFRIKVLSHGRP